MRVFVLDMHGKPAMPCSPRTARLLLKTGHAEIFSYDPFTIKMRREIGRYRQEMTLGVDPGYRHAGLSVTTEREEYYAAELEFRADISAKLALRREARRVRRSRLRHRQPRFDNRGRREGWLCPSVRSRIEAHFNHIAKICRIMPITKIRLETAAFDIQKIKDPDIQGKGYQEGDQLGFWNVREYVLWRDGHRCRHCHGKSGDRILNVHHLESRKTGGDAPNNLITLCRNCHRRLHRGEIELSARRGRSFRAETFMGVMREHLWKRLESLWAFPWSELSATSRRISVLRRK